MLKDFLTRRLRGFTHVDDKLPQLIGDDFLKLTKLKVICGSDLGVIKDMTLTKDFPFEEGQIWNGEKVIWWKYDRQKE